jgi:hypothetical protein
VGNSPSPIPSAPCGPRPGCASKYKASFLLRHFPAEPEEKEERSSREQWVLQCLGESERGGGNTSNIRWK